MQELQNTWPSEAEQKKENLYLATVLANPWIKDDPTAKQELFLKTEAREALFGGAAGGGKSYCLTMAALQYVDVPYYNALLIRRTYGDLDQPGALMDIMRQWLEGSRGVHWDHVENIITFPSGAQLKFGYLRNEADKDRYQGANYHFIGIDELTQFDEDQYLWLMSRNRAPISESDIPLRIWAASNPGRRGHYWVKQRFLIEGELKGRTFVRSLLQDNPHLDYNEYKKTLENLDPVTRQQLLDGNWDVVAGGGFFQRQWFKIMDAPPQSTLKVRFWDLAATPKTETNDPDWTAGALVSMNDGSYCVENIVRTQQTAQKVEELIRHTADVDGPDVAVIIEQEPGASGLQVLDYYRRHVLPDRNLRAFRPTGPKESRIAIVSSHVESGNLMLLRGNWISELLDEAELFPDGHDDQLDSIAGAVAMLQQAGGRTRVRWFGGANARR